MRGLYPQIMSATTFAIAWAIVVALTWTLHRQWWSIRAVRRALWIVPSVVLALIVVWATLSRAGLENLTPIIASVAVLLITMSVALVVMLPFSGAALTVERLVGWLARRQESRSSRRARNAPVASNPSIDDDPPRDRGPAPVLMTRRRFVTSAAAAFPAIAVGSATAGVLGSSSRTVFPEVPMLYPLLPPGLEGLRILHLSDIHLGYFVDLEDLEQTIMDAETKRADLVLVTGDVADDLSVLSEALRLIAGLKPRHGIYASIGNHEYYRGIEQVRRSFDSGPFPLMIDEGTTLGINGSAVRIAAADDPARTGRFNDPVFLRRSVERSVEGAPSDAFHILMSHRPEGFDYAAAEGVDLTLSGHYHGGIQVGWGGRAIIQGFRPDKYYWGRYRKGESLLYTSGGIGHWFPFRLNCPPEAPIYVLGTERG